MRETFGPIAPGVNFGWNPDARTHVELISLAVTLTTAVGGPTREMFCFLGAVGQDDFAILAPIMQPAATTYRYWWGRGIGSFWTAAVQNIWLGALPKGLIFQLPAQLRSDILDLNAADVIDSWTIIYRAWEDPVEP